MVRTALPKTFFVLFFILSPLLQGCCDCCNTPASHLEGTSQPQDH